MNDNNSSQDGAERQVYELGYLLNPSIPSEDVSVHYDSLKDLIVSMAGAVISDEMPRMLALSYTMSKVTQNVRSKFNTAYFGWIKFELDRGRVAELKKKLHLDANIIRFLILKTVRENTIATRRFVQRAFRRRMPFVKREEGSEAPLPLNKEEIDREIDAMVAV